MPLLERRDTPAIPGGVGDYVSLMGNYASGGDSTDTHTSTPFVPHPAGGLRPGAGLLQGYYNYKIEKIGENAKLKVGGLVIQTKVAWQINQQTPPSVTGTFVIAGAAVFAQAVRQGKKLDEAVEAAKDAAVAYN